MSITERYEVSPREHEMFLQLSVIFSEPGMKDFLLELIVSNVMNVLEMTRDVLFKDKFYKQINSAHKFFVWRCEHFMMPLLANKPYIHLARYEDRRSLDIWKFVVDLDNIETLMREIVTSPAEARKSLEDCQELNRLWLKMTAALQMNKTLFEIIKEKYEKSEELQQQDQQRMDNEFNAVMDACMDETLVIDPTIRRYRLNNHYETVADVQEKIAQQHREIVKTDMDYKGLISSSDYTHKQTVMHHEMTIEKLKNKIEFWTQKYEIEWDRVENENSSAKLRVKAIENNLETFKQRLIFIREDTARMAEEEAERLRKAAEEEAQPKKPVKTPKKKKGGNKGKKK